MPAVTRSARIRRPKLPHRRPDKKPAKIVSIEIIYQKGGRVDAEIKHDVQGFWLSWNDVTALSPVRIAALKLTDLERLRELGWRVDSTDGYLRNPRRLDAYSAPVETL